MNLYQIRNILAQGKKLIDLSLKVTFYARVSTDHEEQLNSLENQVMYFEKYIKAQDKWVFVPGYVDEGISGTSVQKRDNFLKMINDAKDGKFNLILTKEISRFSRNTVDSIKYTQELLSFGVGVFFLNDNINTFEPDSELRLTIMSSIAQDEIRKLSERIRFGYKRSIEKGVVTGNNNFYGYKKNKGKLEIVPREAELIRLIFNEYSKEQMGTSKLGHYLYDKYHIVSKTNKPLAGTVITRIIRNPKYKGYYCAHKETTIDYHSKRRIKFKPSEWIVYRDNEACPPIIEEDLWEKCNDILNKNSHKHKTNTRTDMRYFLSGKIKCYHDGATFIKGSYKNKKTGIIRKYWGCSNYRKYGKQKINGCKTPIIYNAELVSIFKDLATIFLTKESEVIKELYSLIKENMVFKDHTKEINEMDKKIEEIKKAKDELIDMRAKKEIDTKEFTRQKEKYEEILVTLETRKRTYFVNKKNLTNSTLTTFYKKIKQMILNDEESLFRVIGSLIDVIYVENTTSHKAVLHFKLKIRYVKSIFNLADFKLLFRNY